MEMALDILSWICLMTGAAFCLIGGLGLLRLPDVFARMHGAGIIDTMGVGMILLGLMFQAGLSIVTVKLVLIIAFILYTTPTATHALSRAILNSGIKPQLDQPVHEDNGGDIDGDLLAAETEPEEQG